jgi:hypothetical protein
MADSDPVPDTAMDTGSDDGEFGEGTDPTALTDDERAILERLRASGDASPGGTPGGTPEESADAAAAVGDDAPLAAYDPPDGREVDPLAPVFREPD